MNIIDKNAFKKFLKELAASFFKLLAYLKAICFKMGLPISTASFPNLKIAVASNGC